jgi:glyceraldehyde-3-phosphate dehydrogenase/erythrose-4-phosphate dehydrogenase
MQFSQIALLGFAGLVAASPIAKRTASAIESDIATISSKLTTLASQVASFEGGLTAIVVGLELLTTFDDLQTEVTGATSDVESTGTLSSTDSATIYSDVSALATKITTVLTGIDAKVCSRTRTSSSRR